MSFFFDSFGKVSFQVTVITFHRQADFFNGEMYYLAFFFLYDFRLDGEMNANLWSNNEPYRAAVFAHLSAKCINGISDNILQKRDMRCGMVIRVIFIVNGVLSLSTNQLKWRYFYDINFRWLFSWQYPIPNPTNSASRYVWCSNPNHYKVQPFIDKEYNSDVFLGLKYLDSFFWRGESFLRRMLIWHFTM